MYCYSATTATTSNSENADAYRYIIYNGARFIMNTYKYYLYDIFTETHFYFNKSNACRPEEQHQLSK